MMKKLKIMVIALCLYVSNTAFAVVPVSPKTIVDLGISGAFSSTTQTTACVGYGSSAAIKFAPTCGIFGAGTSNFTTTTTFFTEPGNSGAIITSQNTTGDVVFQMVRYQDAGAGEYRYPTGRIYVDYVCKYDSTYTVGVCAGTPISTTVHLSRSGRAHIDFFQTFTALAGTQIVGPDCVKNGDKVTYSIFDFMSGPITNRDHYRWTKPGPGWDILYYSYDSSSVTYRANTVNSGVDQLSVSIGDCNSNIRTKIISSPGVVTAPTIVKSYCINPSTATTWNVAFMTNTPVAGVTYSWDIAASGAGFTYASGSTSTTQGPITVNIGSTPSGYILFRASKVVGSGCPNAEHVDTIKFSRAVTGSITGLTCVPVGTSQTYTVTGVPATTSITWTLPSGVTPTGTVTTTGSSSITLTPTSALSYGSISAVGASGTCVGTITGLSPINPIPTLTAISGPVCAARNANVTYTAAASGYDNLIWTSLSGSTVTGSTSYNFTVPSTFTGGSISAVAVKGACTSASVPYNIKWDASGITLTSLTADKTCLSNGVSQTITYTTDPGYDTYTWNLPAGWSGTSTTNTITYTTNGTAGTVSVTAKNGTCGSTNAKPLTVPLTSVVTVTNSGVVNGVVTLSVPTGGTTYQWYKNSSPISGATSNFLILPVTGTVNNSYCVDVTNSSGCVARGCSNSTSNQSARIANTDEIANTDAEAIVVSPNPASKIVQVKVNDALIGQHYAVVNMNGQQVAYGILSADTSIDVSGWSDGMYILKSGNKIVKIQVSK
jgi:hypothetical protein